MKNNMYQMAFQNRRIIIPLTYSLNFLNVVPTASNSSSTGKYSIIKILDRNSLTDDNINIDLEASRKGNRIVWKLMIV